jgi:hypothetical protein
MSTLACTDQGSLIGKRNYFVDKVPFVLPFVDKATVAYEERSERVIAKSLYRKL